MARGVYVLPYNAETGIPIFPAATQGWARCGDPVNGLVLVMVSATDLSGFDSAAPKIVQGNAALYTDMFNVEGQDLIALHAGAQIDPPLYEIPEGEAFVSYEPNLPAVVGSLEAALENPVSGIVELQAGTYTCENAIIQNGVTVRPASGAHVVINNAGLLHLPDGGELYDVDIINANIQSRQDTQGGLWCWRHSKLIGCTITNMLASGVNWFGGSSTDGGTIAECLIFNNGWADEGWGGRAHGTYTHNNKGGQRYYQRNIVLRGFRKNFQAYSASTNNIQNYLVEDNIFGAGDNIIGGSSGLKQGNVWRNNMQWRGGAWFGKYASAATLIDMTIQNNIFGDQTGIEVHDFDTVTESGNSTYDANGNGRGYTVITDPHVVKIVPCTLSQRKLAHIGVLFPKDAEPTSVDLDLSSLELANGDYELVNAHNPDEAHPFTYSGDPVTLPLTGWTQQRPVGWIGVWPEWVPEFSAWILRSA